MNPDFHDRLDARVRELETVVRGLRAELDSARVTATPPEPTPMPAAQAAPDVAPAAVPDGAPKPVFATYEQMFGRPMPAARAAADPARPRISLETLLAGRGLQLVGLLLVLLGAGFFFDLAFARGWIPPLERILLGVAVGSALVAFAARRIDANYTFLAEGLIGLGAAIDYLSLWAAVAVFPDLHIPRSAVFVAMIVVTAVLGWLASTRNSQRLAVMGWFGGFITPVLLAGGPHDRTVLATYLLILSAALLALGVRSSFRYVESLTFLAVLCYAPAFAVDRTQGWTDVSAAVVGTIFFALFAIAFTLGGIRDGDLPSRRISLIASNVVVYCFGLELLFDTKQTVLGVALLVLGAVLLTVARTRALPLLLRRAYNYLGLGAATLAVPALFHATSLLDVYAVEAGLLVVLGTRENDRWVRLAGAAMFAVTGLVVLNDAATEPPQHSLFNPLALTFVIYLASLGFAIVRYGTPRDATGIHRTWRNIALVGFNVVALAALSRECVDVLGGPKGFDDLSSRAQFGLSTIWTIYATVLFGLGLARHEPLLRWLALGLFGCTIFKVFVVDLAALEIAYRIVSFIGLGIVLVAVSAWYQRSMVRQKAAESEA